MLGAFASGWNIIVQEEDPRGARRQPAPVPAYPGTGPFRHVSRKDKEVWIMERNPDYWNKGLPYVDRLEIYNMPPVLPGPRRPRCSRARSTTGGSSIPVSWRRAKETPGMTVGELNQSVIQAVYMNTKKPPLGDPRVRRAMHLASTATR